MNCLIGSIFKYYFPGNSVHKKSPDITPGFNECKTNQALMEEAFSIFLFYAACFKGCGPSEGIVNISVDSDHHFSGASS
jgi:hypothetical protein